MDAPEPVKVAEEPAQIAVGFETAVTIGIETLRDKVLVAIQPEAFEPVTV